MSINAMSLKIAAAIAATVVTALTTSAPASASASGYRSPTVRLNPPPTPRQATPPITITFPETGYRLQTPTWGGGTRRPR
jgi:hypothetical protein